MNMGLVSSGGKLEVDRVLALVATSEIPTLFMLAGSGPSQELEAPWQFAGEIPFKASSLSSDHLRADDRVREAGPDDAGIVCELLEAYGIEGDLFAQAISTVFIGGSHESKVWLLCMTAPDGPQSRAGGCSPRHRRPNFSEGSSSSTRG